MSEPRPLVQAPYVTTVMKMRFQRVGDDLRRVGLDIGIVLAIHIVEDAWMLDYVDSTGALLHTVFPFEQPAPEGELMTATTSPSQTQNRFVAMVLTDNTKATSIANAAGDAVRSMYESAERANADLDPTTILINVRLHRKGVAVTAVGLRVGY